MLPLTVQFIVAMLAYGLNERMARKADYLREENRVLKEALQAATGKTQIPLTDDQRRRLAAKGKALTPTEREECCRIVSPSTKSTSKLAPEVAPKDSRAFVGVWRTENGSVVQLRVWCQETPACPWNANPRVG